MPTTSLEGIKISAADSLAAFSFDLHREIVKTQEGNVFFSPISVFAVLNMMGAGARGETRESIGKALHLGEKSIGKTTIPSQVVEDVVRVANAAFAHNVTLKRGYRDFLERTKAVMEMLDFNRPTEAAAVINKWVMDQTNGKIQNFVNADNLHIHQSQALMVLINTAWFKDQWKEKFDPKETQEEEFWPIQRKSATVTMMRRLGDFLYTEDVRAQILQIPYTQPYVMTIALPWDLEGLGRLEKGINSTVLRDWDKRLHPRKVDVMIPKLKLEQRFSLISVLSGMGLKIGKDANFSGISEETLFVSDVLHQAAIEVDEKSTEAAAATLVGYSGFSGTGSWPKPLTFKANHPYLFMIRHAQTGAILFQGRVKDPNAS